MYSTYLFCRLIIFVVVNAECDMFDGNPLSLLGSLFVVQCCLY